MVVPSQEQRSKVLSLKSQTNHFNDSKDIYAAIGIVSSFSSCQTVGEQLELHD